MMKIMEVIKKFDSQKMSIKSVLLPFSFYSSAIYLDSAGYILERHNEKILIAQDLYYHHEFPALFLPKRKINWQEAEFTFTSEEDIKKIRKEGIKILLQKPIGAEFFYKTETLLNPASPIKRRINQFKNSYEYRVAHACSLEQIKNFYWQWKKQKPRASDNFLCSEDFFFFCLKNLKKYKIKQVYIFVGKKLVGFAWGVNHSSGNWVGLQLKVNYRYKGLSRFLHQERAKLFSRRKFFTLGTGAQESGIIQFKKELGPVEERNYSYVLTGRKG